MERLTQIGRENIIRVTIAQMDAARIIAKREMSKGKTPSAAILKIATAKKPKRI